jgi:hypothetical protein
MTSQPARRTGRGGAQMAVTTETQEAATATRRPRTAISGRKTTTDRSATLTGALSGLTERAFQRQVVDGLKQRGYAVWTVPDMRKTARGLPDVIALGPVTGPGRSGKPIRLLMWELKSATGRVRPEQRNVIDYLQMVPGVDARIVRPADWRGLSEDL